MLKPVLDISEILKYLFVYNEKRYHKKNHFIYIHLQYTPNVFISFSHANPESLDLSKPACIYFILKMSLQNYKRQL